MLQTFESILHINISKNSITEINENMIKSLPNLQSLDASNNKIVFISSCISTWAGCIIKLKLSHNKLTEIPSEITKLKNLR